MDKKKTHSNYYNVTNVVSNVDSFTVTFPYKTGTFVIIDSKDIDINNGKALLGHLGTISCYQCVDEEDKKPNADHVVMVSGYKDSWCGEYLLSNLVFATEKQVKLYEEEMGIDIEDKGWTIVFCSDDDGKPRVHGRYKTLEAKDQAVRNIYKPDSGFTDTEIESINVIHDYNYHLPF